MIAQDLMKVAVQEREREAAALRVGGDAWERPPGATENVTPQAPSPRPRFLALLARVFPKAALP